VPEEGSLTTPALRAAVGSRTEPRTFPIDRQVAARLAEALDEDPATILNEEFAPPFYIAAFETQMAPPALSGAGEGGVLAGDEWELMRPLRWNERITGAGNIADVYERFGGRHGQTLYMRYEWLFVDRDGKVVAKASRIMARFGSETVEAP